MSRDTPPDDEPAAGVPAEDRIPGGQWKIGEVEKELRAQIESAKKMIPQVRT